MLASVIATDDCWPMCGLKNPPPEYLDHEIRTKMFNAHLVLQGYAQLMTIQPNVKSVGHFRQYQTEARENNQGLWK